MVIDYNSAITDTRPDIVLIQAAAARLDSAVSSDPDRPWFQFVDELAKRRRFQPHHISRVRQVWQRIRDHVGPRLILPVTQPTPEGAVQLYWDTGSKYLEIDVHADGTLDWFYKDRTSSERDGTDEERVRGVSSDLLEHLIALVS